MPDPDTRGAGTRFPYRRNQCQVWAEVEDWHGSRAEVMSGENITDALGPNEEHHPTVFTVHYAPAATYGHHFTPDAARVLGEALIRAANECQP